MLQSQRQAIAMTENQKTVSKWAEETFGPASSNARVAARANEEMAELLRCLTNDDSHPKAIEEAADVVIILYRLADRMGFDLMDEIDRKMEVNRARLWRLSPDGHGYHVRQDGQRHG
jgi:NTP pyrophosphatase (non-canonical NTP hydrolase)